MAIGYACLWIGDERTKLSALRLKNATEEEIKRVTAQNLAALDCMIDYNIERGIKLFRISSDIIPLGSHPQNTLDWWSVFEPSLTAIGEKIRAHHIRVSMHPGQYTVLNSIRPDVVDKAVDDLVYHERFLSALHTDASSKMVLHIGGVYGDKKQAMQRFVQNYKYLPEAVKRRLIIENDDKSYTIDEVLEISAQTGAPVVYDNLHHQLNSSGIERDWISLAGSTWHEVDGRQKVHYSQASMTGPRGSHSKTICGETFLEYYHSIHGDDIDIMLEVKDKNLSAIKCIILTTPDAPFRLLEEEWARYKYWVLAKSAAHYQEIRSLMKTKDMDFRLVFYELIEQVAKLPENQGAEINAAQHVWGYVSKVASEKECKKWAQLIEKYRVGEIAATRLRKYLGTLSKKYDQKYLQQSLYFYYI